jgi:hypothetical protein
MKRLVIVLKIMALAFGVLGVGSPVQAGPVILPSGLQPGDQFQVAFVTSGTFSAESSNIADYNRFVSAAATAAGLDLIDGQPVTWNAIGSTATIDAQDNAPQTAPVYDLQGRLITAIPGGLWNSPQLFLDNPIDVTQSGNQLPSGYVWTGSTVNGEGLFLLTLGSDYRLVSVGDLASRFPSWLDTAFQESSKSFHIYALSSPITVPGPDPASVPEPSSVHLGVLGLMSLLTWWSSGRCRGCKTALASSWTRRDVDD